MDTGQPARDREAEKLLHHESVVLEKLLIATAVREIAIGARIVV
jgi:hypothetical protein